MTRYIGVTLLVIGVIAIAVSQKSSLKSRFGSVVLFGAISVFPLIVWVVRNWHISGTFMGSRAPSSYSLIDNLFFTRNTFFRWFLPDRLEPWYSPLMLVGMIMATVMIVFLLRNQFHRESGNSFLLLLGSFVLVYSLFIIVTSTTTAYDQINDRLLAPIYPAVVLLLALALERVLYSLWRNHPRMSMAVLLLVVMWSLFPVQRSIRMAAARVENGAGGYATDTWRESELLANINQLDSCENLPLYSNRADTLYILANEISQMSPAKTRYNSPKTVAQLDDLTGKWPESVPACLIWFSKSRPYLFSAEELSQVVEMSLVAEFEDGSVYLVSDRKQQPEQD